MEPVPATVQAINELDVQSAEPDLLVRLIRLSEQVRRVSPECIGLSLTMNQPGVTFTLVASPSELELIHTGSQVVPSVSFEAEQGWLHFADPAARRSVVSTLALPVLDAGEVTGHFDLYGASQSAFTGRHTLIAEILGAWEGGVVVDGDLEFRTREAAERAPDVLREAALIEVAIGLIAGARVDDLDDSRVHFFRTAEAEGSSPVQLAQLVIGLLARE